MGREKCNQCNTHTQMHLFNTHKMPSCPGRGDASMAVVTKTISP